MSRTFPNPVVSMRKENEVEFVNARTYWSLMLACEDGVAYELRVKHQHPFDTFTFLQRDLGDQIELVDYDAMKARRTNVAVNEPVACDACAALTDVQLEDKFSLDGWFCSQCKVASFNRADADGWFCSQCKVASFNRADAILANRVRQMTPIEVDIRQHLMNHWTAFVTLFNPAINF